MKSCYYSTSIRMQLLQYDSTTNNATTWFYGTSIPVLVRRCCCCQMRPMKKCFENQSKQVHSHCHYNWQTTIATFKEDTRLEVRKRVNYKRNGPTVEGPLSQIQCWYFCVHPDAFECMTYHELRFYLFLRTCVGLYRSSRTNQIQNSARLKTSTQRQCSRPVRACQINCRTMKSKTDEFFFRIPMMSRKRHMNDI